MSGFVQLALCLTTFSVVSSARALMEGADPEGEGMNSWSDFDYPEMPPPESEHEKPDVMVAVSAGRSVFNETAWGKEFEFKWFEQQVDHLNAYHQQPAFLNSTVATFPQRYLINTKAWGGAAAKAPIIVIPAAYGRFYYTHYGFIGELSRDIGAMVIVVSGRFSPEAMPFNESGWNKQANRVGLATAENALRDYVKLLSHLRDVYDPEWVCPLGAVGISLEGKYSAWLRQKFPNVVDFAVASGAPLIGYPGTSDHFAFARIVTEAWWDASGRDTRCMDTVRESFVAVEGTDCSWFLYRNVKFHASFRAYSIPGRCQTAAAMKDNGTSAWDIAMMFCGNLCKGEEGRCPIRDPLSREYPSWSMMWNYLRCTELVHPKSFNGVTDFMVPKIWDINDRANECLSRWGIEPPREGNYHADLFGWHRLPQLADSVSRIFFAYATYDPWAAYAVSATDISPELPVAWVKGGGHGLELSATVPGEDSDSMMAARERIVAYVKRWVSAVQARSAV